MHAACTNFTKDQPKNWKMEMTVSANQKKVNDLGAVAAGG
jgi:hypothetical protein